MKKIGLSLAVLLCSATLFAQQQEPQNQPEQSGQADPNSITSYYATLYQRGIRYNDFAVAKNALYNLVNIYPQNDSLLYSLSVLYYQMQQYASAALTSKDVLSLNPNHLGALEISAVSYNQLGVKEKAIESYEKLFMNTNNFEVLYQLAFLQYDIGRTTEALSNADLLLGKKEASELTVTYTDENNNSKEYPIKAALYNLKGLIFKAQGNKEEARKYFNESLKLAPGFALAQENLKSLE